jgi:hypothetical protein
MRWLHRKLEDRVSDTADEQGPLDAFALGGVETLLFVAQIAGGTPCAEARMLDGGRIPLKLAEPLPLATCTATAGCNCFYSEWPPRE